MGGLRSGFLGFGVSGLASVVARRSGSGGGMWGCSGSGMSEGMSGVGGAAASMAAIFCLLVGLLGDAELVFHLHAELGGGAAELADELSELAGDLCQALGAEEQETEKNDESAVLKAGHVC